ncbi:major facilitator superfamily domain-containing protein [Aspergillus caelatus]|uniref:Major facilitator superfamily domain-containing protein n=1 Tax=Aspergillus caelatus TaxID=61420 RepID=A0A5N7A3T0_9EURO|nr:major facilitator superfamily domain-containing protein [Aspergillus caelatus]KAE8364521.1 major facilitator superfamily domain-containing protein [Aspergillus caelatus]
MNTVNTTGSREAENSRVEGTVTAIFNLGCLFSALSCIHVGDILGRKRTFMLGLIITIIGSILQVGAFSLPHLTIGGFVAGFGFGGVTATGPNWYSFIFLFDWISSVTWRLPLASPCFLCLISLCWAPVWPDSPRWLIKKGRIEEAREILAMLRDEPSDSPSLVHQIEEIEASLQETGQGSFRDIFRNGPARFANRAFIAVSTQMGQQICGANAITFYQSTIYKNYLGMSGNLALLMSAVLFTWKMIIAPVGALTIDKAGRRKSHSSSSTSAFYVSGCIGLTYLYCSEIAPLAVRTQITGMSTASSWAFNFLVVEVTLSGFSSLGWKYFIIYAAISFVLLVPMVYFLFPETESLHLEVIDNIFLDSKHVFQPVSAAKSLRKHARRQGAHGELQVYEKATEEHKEVV